MVAAIFKDETANSGRRFYEQPRGVGVSHPQFLTAFRCAENGLDGFYADNYFIPNIARQNASAWPGCGIKLPADLRIHLFGGLHFTEAWQHPSGSSFLRAA